MKYSVNSIALIVFIVFLIVAIGSWLTILSVNVLFGTEIPVTFETVLAVTWITMTLKGIFTINNLK